MSAEDIHWGGEQCTKAMQRALAAADYEYERKRKLIKYVEQLLGCISLYPLPIHFFTFPLSVCPVRFASPHGSFCSSFSSSCSCSCFASKLDLVLPRARKRMGRIESATTHPLRGAGLVESKYEYKSQSQSHFISIPVTIELVQRSAQLQLQLKQPRQW